MICLVNRKYFDTIDIDILSKKMYFIYNYLPFKDIFFERQCYIGSTLWNVSILTLI